MPEKQKPGDERFFWSDLIATAKVNYNDVRATLAEQLDAAVAHCAKSASRYGANAALKLEIKFIPEGKEEMRIGVSLTSKLPNPEAIEVPVFINKRGELCKDDPSQGALFEIQEGGKK